MSLASEVKKVDSEQVVAIAYKSTEYLTENMMMEHLDGGENQHIGEQEEERENWNNRVEFLLTCIGYSVGLGNLWRFGYLCAKSGGGAFLIPYFICLIIVAVPLVVLEFSVGQFTRRGPVGAMKMLCPLFKGSGIATVIISFFITTYYIVIITWGLYFLIASFNTEVPWKSCNQTWNTPDCWDGSLNVSEKRSNNTRSPSEEFYRFKILGESASFEEFGYPKWDLTLIVLLASIIVYFCIWKGVKSAGKVVYVTALFPYFVLVVILIRGLTLEGSMKGLKYFLVPKWSLLLKPSVWANAAIQNFNSIGVCFGGLITMSSYNKKNQKIIGNALTIACVDAFTSIAAGSTVFSILGYIAHTQGKEVEEVIAAGPGLVFMVIPEAIRNMSWAPFWGFLFFTMIFMLGIDSQFSMVETVVTTIEDEFGYYVKKVFKRKEILVLVVCVVLFFLSMPNICPGGIFYFTLFDYHSTGLSLFYIAFFEIITIVWIYGGTRLAKNIKSITHQSINYFFLACWYIVAPLFVVTVWALNWYEYEPIKYGTYQFPTWAYVYGWIISGISIVSIPIGVIHTLATAPGDTFRQKLVNSIQPLINDPEPDGDVGGVLFKKSNKVADHMVTF